MMNVYVLRHGLAGRALSASVAADRLRPLTPKGRKKMAKIARAMRRADLAFDLILSSPCLRARQTAAIVTEAFAARKQLEFLDALSVGESAEALLRRLARLRPLPENLLLVGHEPQLSRFVSLLLAGAPGLTVQLKKGGLCKLSTSSLKRRGSATLEWLLTPKQMLAMQ
jgi:phosphohistidine phosphatase